MSFRGLVNADFIVNFSNSSADFHPGSIGLNDNFFVRAIIDTGLLAYADTLAEQAGLSADNIITVASGSTVNLVAADSGKTILLPTNAAASTINLPLPALGLKFTFRGSANGNALANIRTSGLSPNINGQWLNSTNVPAVVSAINTIVANGVNFLQADFVELIGTSTGWFATLGSSLTNAFVLL